ncbi:MAG: sulfide/dihydroorotate dehydrogenase-like FAD/NAD-binding protein, partial [Candidatus Omnitrophica bacterium]|nr:sulfide/dihydroorotate dehydrogenase-like FAD/NAD-binding protein [Candidatus Omnitrophota bacterium]
FLLTTDDGSKGEKGLVTDCLSALLARGERIDYVLTAGPIPMMKQVALVTKPYGIKTIASLNPIMVDATGMCGCCRVTVGGKVRFACVDGPDFDAHQVDFDELAKRNSLYRKHEEISRERFHRCRLENKISRTGTE